MGSSDFHDKPFGPSTNTKLRLLKDYLVEWLPVFLAKSSPIFTKINIFDFFAGPGKDKRGEKGSPILILDAIQEYGEFIVKNSLEVNVYFNDSNKEKIDSLKSLIEPIKNISINFSCMEFEDAFNHYYEIMDNRDSANLIFLDQTGIKHINKNVFKRLISLKTTDFLFFISSSTINRFAESPEISQHIPIKKKHVTQTDYFEIHRLVTDYYKGLIPEDKDFYLAPFSLKKGSNIYGLIFGSGHLLGLYKFLIRAWKIDNQRGEANYDIDRDSIKPDEPYLFEELNKPSKVTVFEKQLKERILTKELHSNLEIIKYSITSGYLPKHAKACIQKMKKENEIPEQTIRLSYTAYQKQLLDIIKLKEG